MRKKEEGNRFLVLGILWTLMIFFFSISIYHQCNLEPYKIALFFGLQLLIYLFVRLLFLPFTSVMYYLLLIITIVICLYECYEGLSQLLSHHLSNHIFFSITGSFYNPGPYGGFLAVCSSLLVAHIVKGKVLCIPKCHRLFLWTVSFVAITAIIILPFTQSRSSILAFVCSILMLILNTDFIIQKIKPFIIHNAFILIIGASVIVTGAYLCKKPSADGRFFINKISIKAMCENGLIGAGLGSFGGAYGKAQYEYFLDQITEDSREEMNWSAINERERLTAECPVKAFNEYLHLGVEAGPFNMVLFICLLTSAIVISLKEDTIWCYGLTTFAVFAFFSYPFDILQFKIMFPIILAACISDTNKENHFVLKSLIDIKKSVDILVLTITIIVLSTYLIMEKESIRSSKQAETIWRKAEKWHQMGYYDYAVEECEKIFASYKYDMNYLFAYGQSLNKMGIYEKSDSILVLGTKLSSDPMFWNVMGNNSLAMGRYEEAEERYIHAFLMVPNRMYPLYLLANLYYAEGDTALFRDMAKKVEYFVPKVESIRTERMRKEVRESCFGIINNSIHK